jgi:hypothetical protein
MAALAMPTDNPLAQTPEALLFRRIRSGSQLTPEQRVLAGFEQSEVAIRVVKDGIRHQYPDADDPTIERLLIERIKLMRKLEQQAGTVR